MRTPRRQRPPVGHRAAADPATPPPRPDTPSAAIAEAELAAAPDDRPRPASPHSPTRRDRLVTAAAIGVGGLLGANARYLVGAWAADRWGPAFPWGTLAINVSGSFALGFYLTLVTERFSGRSTTRLFVATGFLGAYTTFSTFGYETVRLVQQGAVASAVAYVAASLVVGLVAVMAGVAAARALSSLRSS